jgi:large repetitive protein
LRVSGALTIVTTTLPRATVKAAYTATLLATGGVTPYTWTLAPGSYPLPPGLTLSPGGVISGIPTKYGLFNFTVKVTDSESVPQSATRSLSILVCTYYDHDECIDR